MIDNLNEMAEAAYQNAKDKGFYDKAISFPERIALMHSELSEALEADRNDRYLKYEEKEGVTVGNILQIDAGFRGAYDSWVKGTFEEEMADVAIRILDLMGCWGLDVADCVRRVQQIDELDGVIWPSDAVTIADKIGHLHAHLSMALIRSEDQEVHWLALTFNKIIVLCKELDIDLYQHIKAKMRYNSLRPRMHGGKKY